MTDEELKVIEERATKALAGPWHPAWNRISDEVLDLGSMLIARAPDDATRAFIAAARSDVPALISEVRRLRAAATTPGQPPAKFCDDCGNPISYGHAPMCPRYGNYRIPR